MEGLEDVTLLEHTVLKFAKNMLGKDVLITKDAGTAIAKASSVFILYLTSEATTIAEASKRKTLNGEDVVKAFHDFQFCDDVRLKKQLEKYKKSQEEKKAAMAVQKTVKKIAGASVEQKMTKCSIMEVCDGSNNSDSTDDGCLQFP